MKLVIDIGSTLIHNSLNPVAYLCELLDLPECYKPLIRECMFGSVYENIIQITNSIHHSLYNPLSLPSILVEEDLVFEAIKIVWNNQMDESYVLTGARNFINTLHSLNIDRMYLSNIWPPFFEFFVHAFPTEARMPMLLSFQTGKMKPNLDLFFQVKRTYASSDFVMIGDSYFNDIYPALATGMKAVWLNDGTNQPVIDAIDRGEFPRPTIIASTLEDVNIGQGL